MGNTLSIKIGTQRTNRYEMTMFNSLKRYKLIFLILIEFLLIYLIYILKTVPGCSGYEPSIYAMYSDTFWLIYFIIYLFSLSLCIYSIFIKYDKLPFYSSLINLLILNSIILLLPLFRGYFSIDLGDSTNHLAYIVDILSTNSVGEHGTPLINAYPITHILSAIVILFTQIKLETIGQIIPLFYYFIFVLFLYLSIKILYKSNEKAILLLLFLFVPILHSYTYYQSQMFFFLIPILLYAFIKGTASKNKSISFRYIIVIFIVLFPFTHPASSLLLMIFFTIICMAWYCIDSKNFTLGGYKNTPFLFIVIWLFWTTSLKHQFGGWIQHYKNWILTLSDSYSYYNYYSTGLHKAELSIVDSIHLYIKIFGPMHLLFGMAFVISLYTIYKWAKKKGTDNKLNSILSLVCLVYIIIYVGSFFHTMLLLGARIHVYVLLISILINANFLFNWVNTSKTKRKKVVCLIFIIILLFSLTYVATFALYDSSFNKRGPRHVTYMNIYGINWLLQTRNDDLSIEEQGGYWQGRITKFLLGYKKASLEPNIKSSYSIPVIPNHFNYTNECLLAKSIRKDCYLLINKKTELISTNIVPEYEYRWAFHPDDYKQLEYDRSIDKIYHNNEIRIFYVNGRRWGDV